MFPIDDDPEPAEAVVAFIAIILGMAILLLALAP